MAIRASESIFRRDGPVLTAVKFSGADPARYGLSNAVPLGRPSSRYCIVMDQRSGAPLLYESGSEETNTTQSMGNVPALDVHVSCMATEPAIGRTGLTLY
jgi:hypothetical protein